MEWVETTAKTVDEAKDRALDQLGVAEDDALFEVLEEPKPGLFGRIRGEARVKARVAPREQRPKQDGRRRRRRSGSRKPSGQGDAVTSQQDRSATANPGGTASQGAGSEPPVERPPAGRTSAGDGRTDELVPVERQAEIMREFLAGLLDAFGLEGEITSTETDSDVITLEVTGENLGLLIGPKGQTLTAVQDLARTHLQRRATGTYQGRVRIDVGGYRKRRQVALGQFAERLAGEVKTSGTKKVLEPMGAADRKVVHDTVNGIDGVRTLSEGEEPRRRVVLVPDG